MQDILKQLNISTHNAGTWSGADGWSSTTDAGVIESVNPTTGELIARVYAASPKDYETVLQNAVEVAKEWRKVPAPQRGEAVRLVNEELRANKAALGALVTMENGKIRAEGEGEVQEMIDIGDFAVGQSRMMYGKTMHSERPDHRMYDQWHPLGVVGIISAFNFPVAVWSWNALLAAIAGNVSIWKPSPKTPLTAIAIQHLCNRALEKHGYPAIFQMFIDDDNKIAQQFVDDPRVNMVSFTGSTEIGKHVGKCVAARMGKSLLELGGNNALIVDESADLDLAVPGIVFGAIGTAGQRCTSTRRVFVHDSHMEEMKARLKKAYGQVRIGDPLDDSTLMGPLIDQPSVERYLNALANVKAAGGEMLVEGERLDRPGNFVSPSIAIVKNEWEIVQEETFAPLLYLIPFSTLDQAIAMQNDVRQGLSSAIFTRNLSNAEQFLSATGSDCGIANVNIGTSGAEIGGAFGGEKETGGGRESGSDSWQNYMRRQTNTINHGTTLPLAQGIKFDL